VEKGKGQVIGTGSSATGPPKKNKKIHEHCSKERRCTRTGQLFRISPLNEFSGPYEKKKNTRGRGGRIVGASFNQTTQDNEPLRGREEGNTLSRTWLETVFIKEVRERPGFNVMEWSMYQ